MTAPTGQAREILNLAPAAPPRPANVRHQFGVIFRRAGIFLPFVWSDFGRVRVFFVVDKNGQKRSVSLVYFRYTRCYDAFTSVSCSWQNKRSPVQKIQVSFVMNEFLAKCGIHQWDLLVLLSKGCSTQIQVKNEAWKTTSASSRDLHGSNWLDDMAW